MRYAAALLAVLSSLNAFAERPFSVDDALAVKNVSDPRVSPDGAWVAYVVGFRARSRRGFPLFESLHTNVEG